MIIKFPCKIFTLFNIDIDIDLSAYLEMARIYLEESSDYSLIKVIFNN
jgi:hypothetical protein